MTKQLPQEIIDIIDKNKFRGVLSIDEIKHNQSIDYLIKGLTPYLSLPQQEDLHDLLGKAFTILCNKDTRSEEDRLMRKQLEMRLENNSMLLDFNKEQEASLPRGEGSLKITLPPPSDDDIILINGVRYVKYEE